MMRVVSWNIELGRNVERAAAEIRASSLLGAPDILLVQEMDPGGVARLADLLEFDHRYGAAADHPATQKPFGNAVLSPWPMGDAEIAMLPHTALIKGQARSVTSAVVSVDGFAVLASSIHLETVLLNVQSRVAQVQTIAEFVGQLGELPSVIGGDFNSASSRSLRHFDQPLRVADHDRITGNTTPTFRRFGRPFALDHFYVRDLSVAGVGVEQSATASDHKPIWATLSMG